MTLPDGGGGVFSIGIGAMEIIARGGESLRRQVREQVRAAGAGQHIDVPVRADPEGFTRDIYGRLHDLRGRFVAEGRDGGRRYGRAFGGSAGRSIGDSIKKSLDLIGKLDFMPVSMLAMPAKIAGIAAAAVAATPVVLGLVSSLGLAAASSAALLPALLGLGATFGIIMGSIKGAADRTDAASVAFTKMIGSWKEELTGLQKIAAAEFLPGVIYFLDSAKTLLPDVKQYVSDLGRELRTVAIEAGDFVASDLFRDRLRTVMGNNTKAVNIFSGAVFSLGTVFADVSAAASNLLPRLASAITAGSQNLATWIEAKRAAGDLDRFFQKAGDAMATWFNIISNLLVGIVNIFIAANPAGEQLAGNLETITKRFRDWTASVEGQQQLRDFFNFIFNIDYEGIYQKVTKVALAFGAISLAIKGMSIGQGIAGVVTTLAGLGPVGLVILAVAAAVVALAGAYAFLYKQSETVRDSLGAIWTSFQQQILPTLEKFSSFFMTNVVPVLRDGAIYYLQALADLLSNTVFPALKSAGEYVLPILERAWGRVTKAFQDNRSELSTLASFLRGAVAFLTGSVIPVVALVAGVLIDQFSRGVSFAIEYVGAFVGAIQEIWKQLVDAKNRLVSVWGSITSFFSSSGDSIKGWIESAKQWFVSIGESIGSAFSSAVDFVVSAWEKIWGVIEPVVSAVVAAVQFWLGLMQGIFDVIFTWIYQIVSDRISLARDIIASILAVIYTVVSTALGSVRDFFVYIWDSVGSVVFDRLTAVANYVGSILVMIGGYISLGLSTILTGWNIAWSWIRDTASGVWQSIYSTVLTFVGIISGTISGWVGNVRDAFSTMMSGIRSIWDSGWRWVHDTASSWGDRIASIGNSIKDRVVAAIRSIPSSILSAINGMIDLINDAIGTVNKILPDRMDIPPLGHVKLPGFAGGGLIRGPGTGTSDSIPLMTSAGPIMGSNGEFMIRARSTRGLMQDYGRGFLDWLNNYDVRRGDASAVTVAPKRRYASGGLISSTQNWIRAQDPKPYVFGAAGPDAWDCSSLVGGVWALLTGRDPNRRYFLTYDLPGAGGFIPGHGLFTIGLSREHVVGNFAGLPFEAANPSDGIIVGSGATSVNSMPAQYYLPQWGEGFMGDSGGLFSDLVGKAVDKAVAGVRDRLPHPGGIANNIVDGLFEKAAFGLKNMEFDNGGWIPPRSTVIASNNTASPERVRTAEQEAALAQPVVIENLELKIEHVDDIAELMDLIGSVRAVARTYGAQS